MACLGKSCINLEYLSLAYCPGSGIGPRPALLFTNQAHGFKRSQQATNTSHPDITAGVWKSQPVFKNFLQEWFLFMYISNELELSLVFYHNHEFL